MQRETLRSSRCGVRRPAHSAGESVIKATVSPNMTSDLVQLALLCSLPVQRRNRRCDVRSITRGVTDAKRLEIDS